MCTSRVSRVGSGASPRYCRPEVRGHATKRIETVLDPFARLFELRHRPFAGRSVEVLQLFERSVGVQTSVVQSSMGTRRPSRRGSAPTAPVPTILSVAPASPLVRWPRAVAASPRVCLDCVPPVAVPRLAPVPDGWTHRTPAGGWVPGFGSRITRGSCDAARGELVVRESPRGRRRRPRRPCERAERSTCPRWWRDRKSVV